MKDKALVTLELIPLGDHDHQTWTRAITALSGVYGPVRPGSEPFGRNTIVFELVSVPGGGQHHLLSVPPSRIETVKSHLAAAVPDLDIHESAVTLDYQWCRVVELKRNSLMYDPDAKDPYKQRPLDPLMVSVLRQSMRNLNQGEAVVVQWVVTPTGRLRNDKYPEFLAVGRLAAAADYKDKKLRRIRMAQLIAPVLSAYRSLHVFSPRPLPRSFNRVVSERSAPVVKYAGAYIPEELAVMCGFPIGRAPGRRKLAADNMISSTGIVLGTSNYPGRTRPVAVSVESLTRHAWIIGPTGSGKTALLHHIAHQIIAAGYGLVLVDPKGKADDLAWQVVGSIVQSRIGDVTWLDAMEQERPVGLNALAGDPEQVTGHVVSLIKNHYRDSWGPRLEDILYHSVMTAAEAGLTLYDVKQLLENEDFRRRVVHDLKDDDLKLFWQKRDSESESDYQAVTNKVNAFVRRRAIKRIVGQTGGLNLSEVVNRNKIVIARLPIGELDEESVGVLGSLLVAQLWQAIRTRKTTTPFFLIADEVQMFVGKAGVSLESILTMARSYGFGVIGAHQGTQQPEIKPLLHSLRTNARSKIAFQVEEHDARTLAPDFAPLEAADLRTLGEHEVAARLRTDKGMAPVATLITNPPPQPTGHAPAIIAASRALGVDVADIESAWKVRHSSPGTGRTRPPIGREES